MNIAHRRCPLITTIRHPSKKNHNFIDSYSKSNRILVRTIENGKRWSHWLRWSSVRRRRFATYVSYYVNRLALSAFVIVKCLTTCSTKKKRHAFCWLSCEHTCVRVNYSSQSVTNAISTASLSHTRHTSSRIRFAFFTWFISECVCRKYSQMRFKRNEGELTVDAATKLRKNYILCVWLCALCARLRMCVHN